MPDVYATITEAGQDILERLAEVLELRAADPQQQAMRDDYLAGVKLDAGARVLEVGCGTGAVTRALAVRPNVAEAVGADPSPVFLEHARRLGAGIANLRFEEADARELPFADGEFDAVVVHTTLCHIPGPERALAEAFRVLRPGGWLALFDGDYATTTCANGDGDPLQGCAEAAVGALVLDRWLARRLPSLVADAGFAVGELRSHGFVEAPASRGYFFALIERGADILAAAGRIGLPLAEALKDEARRRSEAGEFYGHIAYASVVARRPKEA